MSVKIQRLVGPVLITDAAVSYFTAQVATRLDKVTVSNPDTATAYSVAFYVVPQGGAADATHNTVPTRFIQALEGVDITALEGHDLNVGDQLYAVASVTNKLSLLISGTLVT